MSQRWRIAPSELDCNLAVSAYLRACTKFPAVDRGGTQALTPASGNGIASPTPMSGGLSPANGGVSDVGASPGIAAADLSELFPLLFRMQSQGMGIHPAIRDDFDPMGHPAIPPSLKDFLGGVQMTMRALPMVPHPSAARARLSQQQQQQQHTPLRQNQQQNTPDSSADVALGLTSPQGMDASIQTPPPSQLTWAQFTPTAPSASASATALPTTGPEKDREVPPTNVVAAAEAADAVDVHPDVFDLSAPITGTSSTAGTSTSGTGINGMASADENDGEGRGQVQWLGEEHRREGESIHNDTGNAPFQDSQRARSAGERDVTDAAAAASSSSSSEPGDDDAYDSGDPLVNFSEEEMRSFALMDALARALLSSSGSSPPGPVTHITSYPKHASYVYPYHPPPPHSL